MHADGTSDEAKPQSAAPASTLGAARCRHFGACGGCASQDTPYPDQIEAKRARLADLLAPYANVLDPVIPASSQWFYRNKMEFAFGFKGEEVTLGLRRRGRFFGVVNLEECFLMSEAAGEILSHARAWASRNRLKPYHLRKHTGFLRYVVFKEGKRTGERLVILVTAPPENPAEFDRQLEELAGPMRAAGVTTLIWAVTERNADLAIGECRRTLFGEPFLRENLAGISFTLSPYAFFQPNVELSEKLIGQARQHLGEGWPMLVDLYSGAGGFTLTLARQVKRAIGVELDADAAADAGRNAAANGIANVNFVAEDALGFLRRFSNYSFLSDRWAVILDPPRSGMHPKMPAQLLRVAPPVILYVSCNPKKLAEDLSQLAGPYHIDAITPYDFFPHTPHIELLAKLTRK